MLRKDRDFYTILKCKVGSTKRLRLLNDVRERLTISDSLFVITPNSENVLGVYRNDHLQKIVGDVDYAPADSIGLVAAGYFMRDKASSFLPIRFMQLLYRGMKTGLLVVLKPSKLRENVPLIKGRELFIDLLKIANENKWRVYLLGGMSNEAELTQKVLDRDFPDVTVRYSSGPMLNDRAVPVSKSDKMINSKVLKEIKAFKPHLLFVAFNFPKQEQWLATYLPNLPVGLGMTVGGTFNYVSGKSKLPPRFANTTFEWLWRLITEPWRWKRVFNAVVVFPCEVFKYKLLMRNS